MSKEPRFSLDEIIDTPCAERGWNVPAIICKDGAKLSVQASSRHYCSPRDSRGPWGCVEVGFPTVKPPDEWEQWAEDWNKPTETVYGWVPIDAVREFIALHGGEAAKRKHHGYLCVGGRGAQGQDVRHIRHADADSAAGDCTRGYRGPNRERKGCDEALRGLAGRKGGIDDG